MLQFHNTGLGQIILVKCQELFRKEDDFNFYRKLQNAGVRQTTSGRSQEFNRKGDNVLFYVELQNTVVRFGLPVLKVNNLVGQSETMEAFKMFIVGNSIVWYDFAKGCVHFL